MESNLVFRKSNSPISQKRKPVLVYCFIKLPMLKSLHLSAVLFIQLIGAIALPCNAAPEQTQSSGNAEIYLGVAYPGEAYAARTYILPSTIKVRGDSRRFQTHDVFFHDQGEASEGSGYRQMFSYQVANCRDGKIGLQRADYFNTLGKWVDRLAPERLKMATPLPGDINEKVLDFVCDYKP